MSAITLKNSYINKNFDSVNRIILNYVINYRMEGCWPHIMRENNISFTIGYLGDLNLCENIENDKRMCIYCLFYGICYGGHKELFEKYYKKFADANGFNSCDYNDPFYYSCRGNNINIAKLLPPVSNYGSRSHNIWIKYNHNKYERGLYYILCHQNKDFIEYFLKYKTKQQLKYLKNRLSARYIYSHFDIKD